MENRLQNNSNQRLLEGRQGASAPLPNQDVIIENVAERRYLWTARAFAVITAISVCCNIILILAISQIFPLYRIEPFLLTFQDKNEQVYHVSDVDKMIDKDQNITEIFVREYVLLRSTFENDLSEMETRWLEGGPIQEMSEYGLYLEFIKKDAEKVLKEIRTKGLTRDIKIITVNELSNGLWQVEYEAQDMYPSSATPRVSYWTASLEVKYRQKIIKHKDRMKNPVGFTVTKYSLNRNRIN